MLSGEGEFPVIKVLDHDAVSIVCRSDETRFYIDQFIFGTDVGKDLRTVAEDIIRKMHSPTQSFSEQVKHFKWVDSLDFLTRLNVSPTVETPLKRTSEDIFQELEQLYARLIELRDLQEPSSDQQSEIQTCLDQTEALHEEEGAVLEEELQRSLPCLQQYHLPVGTLHSALYLLDLSSQIDA